MIILAIPTIITAILLTIWLEPTPMHEILMGDLDYGIELTEKMIEVNKADFGNDERFNNW